MNQRGCMPFVVRRPSFVAVCLIAFVVSGFSRTSAQAPLPELTKPVNDFANIIDPAEEQQLDGMIRRLQEATGDVVVIATVDTAAPFATPRDYAVELFENRGRGIGARGKDNGVLILVAVKERRVEIEVGYGLEQWITDGFAGETSRDDIAPQFRNGRFGAGLIAGTTRIVNRIADGRKVELSGVPRPVERRRPAAGIPVPLLIAIFIALFLMSRRRARTARRQAILGARRLERLVERRGAVRRRRLDARRFRRRRRWGIRRRVRRVRRRTFRRRRRRRGMVKRRIRN